ncbi:DUF935 domain-containing protein [Roseomonas sp. HJA6]|uniref:DUF935 domain-containing protein n=1 Tax=Roseomonas alba TaxID=2846776 RepID=A0ABS7AI92_9PROT|nr:DUF935 family protein [Neoroseomonas alba]MBW6402043.1 DUF935 domain-containing protein [Neoroseomonas alba]
MASAPQAPRPRQIIDQWGNPIPPSRIAQLRQHQAMPRVGTPRSPYSTYQPTRGLTPASLGALLSQSAQGQSQQLMELLEEIEEKDLHYASVLSTRKRQVAQLPITVTAASEDARHKEHADFLRRWLDTDTLAVSLVDMLDGVSKGFSVLEISWLTEPRKVWPLRLVYRPQRFFDVDWRDGDTVMMRDNADLVPLGLHKFVVHRHPSKSGNLLRSGIGRVAVWAWMFKSFTMQDWAIFVHNYGAPIRLGRYGPESTEEDRAVLWRAVANVAGDMAAIVPKSMEVEFVQVQNAADSAKLYEARCRYLDEQISKVVLGQTATTDANPGSHAAGQTHRLVQEDIERSDAGMLSTTVNRQLAPQIIAFNFGPQDAYPRVHIGRPDEVPLKDVIDGVQKLGPLGLRVRGSEMRDRLGLKPVEEAEGKEPDEDVIGGRAPAPTPTVGAAGGPGGADLPRPTQIMKRLVQLQSQGLTDDAMDALVDRLSADAAGALHGLTAEVLQQMETATDLPDLAQRLVGLRLDPAELATAIGRSLALANLVGQALVADETAGA